MDSEERARDRRQRMTVDVIREGHDDGAFDLVFWGSVSAEQRFSAAWQCVLDWAAFKRIDGDQLRLQRSAVRIQRG